MRVELTSTVGSYGEMLVHVSLIVVWLMLNAHVGMVDVESHDEIGVLVAVVVSLVFDTQLH